MRLQFILSLLGPTLAQIPNIFQPPALGAPAAASTPTPATVTPTSPIPAAQPVTPTSPVAPVVSSSVPAPVTSAVAPVSTSLGGITNPSVISTPTVSQILSSVGQQITSAVVPTITLNPSLNATAVVVVVTQTILSTNAAGSTVTSLSTSSALAPGASAVSNSASDSNTGKTWGIIGGVIGGILLLSALIFIIYRMSQKRFSDLDDEHDGIKWPELQPEGKVSASASTLNPLGTRRTGRAGIDMGDDEREEDPSYEHQYQQGSYGASEKSGQYYDPYLGGSSAPQPQPVNIYPPSPYRQPSYSQEHIYPSYSQQSLPSTSTTSVNLGDFSDPMNAGVNRSRSNGQF